MTGTCPPDGVLEQLLTDPRGGVEKEALELHVAGCAACRRRLEQLNRGGLTLPGRPAGPASDREDMLGPTGVLERAANFLPSRVPLPANHTAPEREFEATGHFTPSPAEAPGAETPPVAAQQTTDFTPPLPAEPLPPGVPPSGPAPGPPAAFGRYQVRHALGAGGYGTVYLGHDTELDRPVAIKVLIAGSAPVGDRSLQEARRLARLRHPGIVTVHDVGVQDGQVYIVSDYLDGPDLGRWLRDNRPTWPEAARIAATLADALAHAHARLIVHRDIKPANILLTADRVPVLVDFGLALDEAGAVRASRTRTRR